VKKVAAIFLVFIYTLSFAGVAVNKFYCCGELVSTTLSSESTSFQTKDGCCKTTASVFKVKDQHIHASLFSLTNAPAIAFISSFFQTDFSLIYSLTEFVPFNSHAPPYQKSSPIFILNCTFRV
jgi:hypothetical protein